MFSSMDGLQRLTDTRPNKKSLEITGREGYKICCLQYIFYVKCSKNSNASCLPKKALTNSADPDQTASEAV